MKVITEENIEKTKKEMIEWLNDDMTWETDLDGEGGFSLGELVVLHFVDKLLDKGSNLNNGCSCCNCICNNCENCGNE
jgi:hypothetical protein